MTKDLWINLPVKNLKDSKEFFIRMGFALHPRHEHSEDMAGFVIGVKKIMVMLFPEPLFKTFIKHEITDTITSVEFLISIDVESKEEVDEMAKKAKEAGGTVFAEPGGKNELYGCGFADLDGHRWNVLYWT